MSSLAVALGRTGRPWWPVRRHEAAPVARAAGSAATAAVATGAATFRPDVEGLRGAALARMIERLPGRVVVIADTPAWNLDVPSCLSSHARDIRACAMPRKLALSGGILARERAATRATGAGLVNLTRAICDADPCPAVVNGRIVLRDSHHLTATFARSLAPVLNRALDRLSEAAVTP